MAEMLVIVESPAKAKTIGKFLGSKYKVVASNGHVRDLPKSQLGVDVEHDFVPKYITLRGRGAVLDTIRREAKNAKKVFLATDPDMEGEAISWHLAQVLKLDLASKCRIEFNEITANTVKNSVKSARAIDMDLVDAQQARRVLDRLVGYKISPILWDKVRRGLSAGRVQSVACRILCDREQEIIDFVPEEFWTVCAALKVKGVRKPVEAKFYGYGQKKVELHTEAEAKAVVDKSAGQPFVVQDVKVSDRVRHAPAPFTTSSLQQEAGRKLGFTTKLTMVIAQQLYEGVEVAGQGTTGLITYIRTDSVRIAEEAQQQARGFIAETYGAQYVPDKPNIYKGRKGAQDAHEAIRPSSVLNTPQAMKGSLNNNQFKLYKLIYERFVASQMCEARYEVSSVSLLANGCEYKVSGTRTLFNGYTAVYTEGRDDAGEEAETMLPKLLVGDSLSAESIEKEQHFTQAPPRFTEASLVKLLEEKGIGRPSTYAPTISTILGRGYVQREKKQLIPTELGFVVTQLLKENFSDIIDVKFTADMEDKLDLVRDGETEWKDVIRAFYGPFAVTVEKAAQSIEKVVIADEVSDIPCEKCGAMMVYKMGRFGKFLACPNFPACRNTKAIVEHIDVPCPKCGAGLIKRKSKRGKVFYGCEKYPACDFISWDRPAKERCPQCGALMVQKMSANGGYTVCTNKECGHVVRPPKKEAADE
ncbi:MAG: type I DNA topoisomerase [Christensenellaceae bacterium]|jgi:DNA topoisomerase-1|nr:type I DNA topoisomerase [Christensenellaceae bacterium]